MLFKSCVAKIIKNITRCLKYIIKYNDQSIAVCYEGGLNERGEPADTRTYAQKCSLLDLLRQLRRDYPQAAILGHYQLSPYIRKACPCFNARKEYGEL